MGFVNGDEGCRFCQIIMGQGSTEFVYRDEFLVVFHDIHPAAPVHLLIVPVKHIRSVNDLTEEDKEIVSRMIFRARDAAREFSIAHTGYRLQFNVERGAGQVIFHIHLHLTGGWGRMRG
jgi:histidine triad (HIT) family protein